MASRPFFDKRRGTWCLKYRPSPTGPWVRVVLCKHPGAWSEARPPKKPPLEAEDRAREFAAVEYRAKHGLAAGPVRAVGLAGYLAAYIQAHAETRKRGSTKQLRRHTATFLDFCARKGISTVQGVTRATCRDYLALRVKSVAPSTLKVERGYLVGIWTRAVEEGLIAVSPWTGVKVPGKAVDREPTFWTSAEIARIAAACRKPWHRDLVLILANTGLRISTALAMRWDWIDWTAGRIVIPSGEGIKTSYAHALNRVARDVLARRKVAAGDSPLVFPNPYRDGGIVPYDSARSAIERAIARAGVPPGRVHDLRHSYGRALALAGVPVTVIQSQLGHTTLAMALRYVRTTEKQAADFIGDWGVGDDR